MKTKEIIELLKEKETEYLLTKSFSKHPGIYALFFIGKSFPLLGDSVYKHQIIYIGKTESSQEKRDAKTHFKTGKTGSSTVRKSIGSLLCSKENLKPMPRNVSDYIKGRFSHFKFDNPSELIITNWMENNLALSFYDYSKTKKEIEELETKIINELVPILNISKNPNNSFKGTLQKLRRHCASVALKNADMKENTPVVREKSNAITRNKMISDTSIDGSVHIDNITKSDIEGRNIRIKVENKHIFPAEKSGNPTSYSLNFKVGNFDFMAKYMIGSKDGKSRSGILKLGDRIYQDTLKIRMGTNLKISKLDSSKYTIEIL